MKFRQLQPMLESLFVSLMLAMSSSARSTWRKNDQGPLHSAGSDTRWGVGLDGAGEASSSELLKMFARDESDGRRTRLNSLEDVSDNILSEEEVEMIKHRVLDALGLSSIPKTNLSNISRSEFNEAYREYLTAVEEEEARYEEQLRSEEESLEDDSENDDSKDSYRFYSNRVTRQSQDRERRSIGEGKQIIHFQVFIPSATSNTTSVVRATSRFWKKGNNKSTNASSVIPVTFYRLDKTPKGKSTELSPVLLKTVNVSVRGNEWIEIDMTEAVVKWLKYSNTDTGVLIQCPSCESAGVHFTAGGSRKGSLSGRGRVPRLDVHTEILGIRVKRSRKMHRRLKKNRRLADCQDATHKKGRRSKRCCRRSMQVRFSDLPQFDFIISPKEFDAFYCSGRCPARYNPANEHALLQSFLNLKGKRDIPGPCCAPTELKGLPILHIGANGKLKTTFWSDVIVTKCGCA